MSNTIPTFRITEPDLAKLEAALPRLCEMAGMLLNRPEAQMLFGECKEILSNVRWDYGPPTQVIQAPFNSVEGQE
jgi:hypothetical protein